MWMYDVIFNLMLFKLEILKKEIARTLFIFLSFCMWLDTVNPSCQIIEMNEPRERA